MTDTEGPVYMEKLNHLGRVVQSWVKITQGYCKIWTQTWEFNSLCLQFDDWILQTE